MKRQVTHKSLAGKVVCRSSKPKSVSITSFSGLARLVGGGLAGVSSRAGGCVSSISACHYRQGQRILLGATVPIGTGRPRLNQYRVDVGVWRFWQKYLLELFFHKIQVVYLWGLEYENAKP